MRRRSAPAAARSARAGCDRLGGSIRACPTTTRVGGEGGREAKDAAHDVRYQHHHEHEAHHTQFARVLGERDVHRREQLLDCLVVLKHRLEDFGEAKQPEHLEHACHA